MFKVKTVGQRANHQTTCMPPSLSHGYNLNKQISAGMSTMERERERRANCCGFSVLQGIVSQTLPLQRWTSLSSRLLGERGRSQGGPPSSEVSVNGGRAEQREREAEAQSRFLSLFYFTLSFFHFLSLSVFFLIFHCIFRLPVGDSLWLSLWFVLAGTHRVDDTELTHSSENTRVHRAYLIFCHLFVIILN